MLEDDNLPDEQFADQIEEEAAPQPPSREENLSLKALEQLADDVQRLISDHSRDDKPGMLSRLQQEIARCPELNKPAFKIAITT